MILVAVGASQFPFDRLLRAIGDLAPCERVVVQHGPSQVRPPRAECVPFVPFDTLAELVRDARAVVTHAGVGSILTTLSNGKRPYVVPRLRRFAEAVDDHQLASAKRFAEAGLVTLVEDPGALADVLVAATDTRFEGRAGEGELVRDLRRYLEAVVRRDAVPVSA
jgi:UDP-N-acetylglucosamine transferase subunit ALG13